MNSDPIPFPPITDLQTAPSVTPLADRSACRRLPGGFTPRTAPSRLIPAWFADGDLAVDQRAAARARRRIVAAILRREAEERRRGLQEAAREEGARRREERASLKVARRFARVEARRLARYLRPSQLGLAEQTIYLRLLGGPVETPAQRLCGTKRGRR